MHDDYRHMWKWVLMPLIIICVGLMIMTGAHIGYYIYFLSWIIISHIAVKMIHTWQDLIVEINDLFRLFPRP